MDETTISTTPVAEEVITETVAPMVEATETSSEEAAPVAEDKTETEEVIPAVVI